MAANHVQPGEVMEFTAAAALAIGVGVKIGLRIGVTLAAVANGAAGRAAVWGVWNLPKLTTDVVAEGALLYWDDTNKRLTTTATANTLAGYAFKAASGSATAVDIKINA